MTKRLVAIDPGKATGVSVWRVPGDEPIERIDYKLIQGGADGFIEWMLFEPEDADIFVVEQFIQDGRTPRVDPNALQIEGFLKGYELVQKDKEHPIWEFHWQRNAAKGIVGDKVLKQHGYWLTGKQVGWTDGRDVNDSQLHALYWAKLNHRPSLEYYFPKKALNVN